MSGLRLAGRIASYTSVSSAEAGFAGRGPAPLDVHALGAEPVEGASNIPGRPHIYPMPSNPLALLRELHELLKAGAAWGVLCVCLGVGCWSVGRLAGHGQASTPARLPLTNRRPTNQLPPTRPPHPHTAPPPQELVDQLRQKCLEEPRDAGRPASYSALTQDPKEWTEEARGRAGRVALRCGRATGRACLPGRRPACRPPKAVCPNCVD